MTTIRCARTYDAAALAALAGELGYPATRREIVARLAAIEARADACVLVAEDAEGRVVGWLHVAETAHLVDAAGAEILGLVVAAHARGSGIGAELVCAGEAWARRRGAERMTVRSRVERTRAHDFYARNGYARRKTQVVFSKPLG
ncbi:MAG TPA: GNAT family N-acetyltransferase [Dokdonella sp.]